MKRLLYYFSIISLLGCTSQEKQWENVSKINTIIAYENYLTQFPTGKYTLKAKENIENLIFDSVIKINSTVALNDFLKKFPESKHLSDVNKYIENLEWEKRKLSPSIDTLQSYIDKFPDSKYINDAVFLLDSIKYNPSKEDLENCLKLATKKEFGYPNSNYVPYVSTTILIQKIYKYDKKLGYMRVDGGGMVKTTSGEYTLWPKYYKVKTDGKGNWSAIFVR